MTMFRATSGYSFHPQANVVLPSVRGERYQGVVRYLHNPNQALLRSAGQHYFHPGKNWQRLFVCGRPRRNLK